MRSLTQDFVTAPRLLFVVTGLGGGGAENALLNLCKYIVASRPGATIIVICLVTGGDGPIASELRRLNVRVIDLQNVRRRRGVSRLYRQFVEVLFFRPHVIQGWMYHGNVVAWGMRNLCFPGTRLVGSVHSLWSQPKHVSAILRLARGLNLLGSLLDFDHTFYAGYASRSHHIHAGFPRIRGSVLPNGVQFDCNRPVPDSVEVEAANVPVFVHISRKHPDKDNDNFIKTVATLESRQFRCHIDVLGPGLDAEYMRRELPTYEAFRYTKVEAHGFRTDARLFLRRASILLLTSKSEAFPVSLIEGLGAGVVCVGTDVGDCREIIGDCGQTVPPGRADLLTDALMAWAAESHRHRAAWASRCRARAMARFSLETMGRIYMRVFSDLEGVEGSTLR